MPEVNLMHGDCLDKLKEIADNSIDSIITDPPYGLGAVKDVIGLLSSWIKGEDGNEHVGNSGFMGKQWDKSVPPPSVWKECLRVLKPGGHMLVFAGTRTQDLMGMSIRIAGAELRDEISVFGIEQIHGYGFGSGFPKGCNISKAIDNKYGLEREVVGVKHTWTRLRGDIPSNSNGLGTCLVAGHTDNVSASMETAPACEDSKKWEGWNTSLKPSHEPILMFRKPLSEKTVVDNVLKYGTGALNINACRIVSGERKSGWSVTGSNASDNNCMSGPNMDRDPKPDDARGRWPSNTMFVHHPECECLGMKEVDSSSNRKNNPIRRGGVHVDAGGCQQIGREQAYVHHGDENGKEQVEDWKCHPDCVIGQLPTCTSGEKKLTNIRSNKNSIYGDMSKFVDQVQEGSTGSASRFFYCAKASKSDREFGLSNTDLETKNGVKNIHPTVKPHKLMVELCKLVTQENGVILDPFMGSGSTGRAAVKCGMNFIGIECDDKYFEIAKARIGKQANEIPVEDKQRKLF